MKKIILIPGNGGGSPQDNWFPYLSKQFAEMGILVIAREFPDNDLAREKYWIPYLKELGADSNSILIGHSSGAIAAMRFAEKNNILGSVLVGAYHTDLGIEKEKLSGYFDRPWDFDAIKKNQQWISVFASKDDPWIPISEPRFLAEQLDAYYFEYDDQGHFGGDYHKPEFPEIIKFVQERLS